MGFTVKSPSSNPHHISETGGQPLPAFTLAIAVMSLLACGFIFHARYIADKVYRADPDYRTQAHRFDGGVDFIPTDRHVLFSHHFISVAGAAPSSGPPPPSSGAGCPP